MCYCIFINYRNNNKCNDKKERKGILMYIEKIKLQNFRNYEQLDLNLNKNINIIYGNNAQGKTNIFFFTDYLIINNKIRLI